MHFNTKAKNEGFFFFFCIVNWKASFSCNLHNPSLNFCCSYKYIFCIVSLILKRLRWKNTFYYVLCFSCNYFLWMIIDRMRWNLDPNRLVLTMWSLVGIMQTYILIIANLHLLQMQIGGKFGWLLQINILL